MDESLFTQSQSPKTVFIGHISAGCYAKLSKNIPIVYCFNRQPCSEKDSMKLVKNMMWKNHERI